MPYNFETNTGTVYVGNTPVPGLGFLDSVLGGVYTGAVLDPGSSYSPVAPVTGAITDFNDWVKNAGQTVSDTVQAGNTLTTGLGVLSGSLGLILAGGAAYLLAKNQKWIK